MVSPATNDNDPRAYPARPLLAVSAAVFREGCVLIARRAAPPLAGLWSLPGGLVEAGEPLTVALARELTEEVGVEADIVGLADTAEIIRRDAAGAVVRHYVILCHAARWRAGEARCGEETDAVRWIAPGALDGIEMTEGAAAAAARAAAMIGGA